jgi:hypothetical protein
MKRKLFTLAIVAAGFAGCAATPGEPYRNERDLPIPPGQGMFGDATTWEFRRREPAPAAPATAAEQEEFLKWRQSAGGTERQEFEEWRAWREWKRNNPK